MRILHAVHGFTPEFVGGVERTVAAVASAQVGHGDEVAILAGSDAAGPGPRLDGESVDGLLVFRLSGAGPHAERGRDLPEAGALVGRLLAELKPDVLHIHSWLRLPLDLAALAARAAVPAVATFHDLWPGCPRVHRLKGDLSFCTEPWSVGLCTPCVRRDPWETDAEVEDELGVRRAFLSEELRLLRRAIVPSAAQARFLFRLGTVPGESVAVLEDPAGELPGAATPPPEDGILRAVHWGNLIPEKGVHVILEAVRLAAEETPVALELWGTSPDPAYRARLHHLAEGQDVRFRGGYVPSGLAGDAADLAVFASLAHESHSLTLDEAFALGVPVVVSDRGAPPERIGGRGLVVPAGDAEALARVLVGLARDRDALARMRLAPPAAPPLPIGEHVVRLASILREAIVTGPPPLPARPTPEERLAALDRRARRRRDDLTSLREAHAALEARASSAVSSRDVELQRLYEAERDLRAELSGRDTELQRLYDAEAELRKELEETAARAGAAEAAEAELAAELGALRRRLSVRAGDLLRRLAGRGGPSGGGRGPSRGR